MNTNGNRRATVIVATLIVLALPVGSLIGRAAADPHPRHPTSSIDWLSLINHYRAQAGLPPVTEDHAWSDAALKHSIYGVKEDDFGHGEDTNSPYYSVEGDQAAGAGILFGVENFGVSEDYLTSSFMTTPLHGLSFMTATQTSLGYGFYAEDIPGNYVRSAVTITTIAGDNGLPPDGYFPVVWPGEGSAVPFTHGGDEIPDPVDACGFEAFDWGLPIIFQFARNPLVTQHSLRRDGVDVPHCVLDSSNGRDIQQFNAALIVPRDPLVPGSTYTASLTTERGETASTSFTVTDLPVKGCHVTAVQRQPTSGPFAVFRDNNYAPGSSAPEDWSEGEALVSFDDGISDYVDIVAGPEADTFYVSGPHTYGEGDFYGDPGTYHLEITIQGPYRQEYEVQSTLELLPEGSTVPPQEPCDAPPLPPAPPYPPMRPPVPTDGPGPTPGSTSGPSDGSGDGSGGELYARSIGLRLRGHLKAVGSVSMETWIPRCVVAQTVDVEKIKNGDWTRVKSVITTIDGTFRVRLRDKPGKYRAWMDPVTANEGQCLSANSRTRRHRH